MRDLIVLSLFAVAGLCALAAVFLDPLRRWDVRRIVSLAVSLLVLAMVGPAFAQAVVGAPANSATLFNIPPLVWQQINELLVGLFMAIGLAVWKWIDAHSPLKKTQAEEIARNAFMTLLATGAKFGVSQLQAQEKRVGSIDVGNAAVAAGANFVIAHGADLAAKVGFDVTTADGQAAIIRSVTARISSLLPSNIEGSFGDTAGPTAITLPESVQPAAVAAGQPVAPPIPTPAPAHADATAEAASRV